MPSPPAVASDAAVRRSRAGDKMARAGVGKVETWRYMEKASCAWRVTFPVQFLDAMGARTQYETYPLETGEQERRFRSDISSEASDQVRRHRS